MKKKSTAPVPLWGNRIICLPVATIVVLLPNVIDWYGTFRVLTPVDRTAITVFYCCTVFIGTALWNTDRLLRKILKGHVFVQQNVRRIRTMGWCCGSASLICVSVFLPICR